MGYTFNNTLEWLYEVFDSIKPNESGCHIYPSRTSKHHHHHPRVTINGYSQPVNRFALERKLDRSIREGYFALHHCDINGCVNPEHLYEGTQKDNMRDRSRRNLEWLAKNQAIVLKRFGKSNHE
jgi:hypothetical protein